MCLYHPGASMALSGMGKMQPSDNAAVGSAGTADTGPLLRAPRRAAGSALVRAPHGCRPAGADSAREAQIR